MKNMIDGVFVVTGACGFIGSCLIHRLNDCGLNNVVAVDVFDEPEKLKNIQECDIAERINKNVFFDWLDDNQERVKLIVHLGAISATTEFNEELLKTDNTDYTKTVWEKCSKYNIPLIYASSAATYGDGSLGYSDLNDVLIYELKPLNPYGVSKNEFDKWCLQQEDKPPFWYGLKFFNVYGPHENHKHKMASVVYHAYNQILTSGKLGLFKSYRKDFADGHQLRDFVFVEDVLDVIFFLYENKPRSGIYNVGTSKARTFLDLGIAVFAALEMKPCIEFIEMPIEIRDKYQYFTEADITKLRSTGYDKNFTELEVGVKKYIDYLKRYSTT
jgi:ADP-L-glycero-D-manno-heptose 6-epimerase